MPLDEKTLPALIQDYSSSDLPAPSTNYGGARPGAGRKRNQPGKINYNVKAMLMHALHKKGGVAYLEKIADEDPKAFCSLLGKMIPTTLEGNPDAPVAIVQRIELVAGVFKRD